MNYEENLKILTNAIEIAIKNSYIPPIHLCEFNIIAPITKEAYFMENMSLSSAIERLEWYNKTFNNSKAILGIYPHIPYYYQIIFDLEFLKAFFKTNIVCDLHGKLLPCCQSWAVSIPTESWNYHAKELLFSKDKFKYLKDFIENNI